MRVSTILLLLTSACTASWPRVVRYSTTPAPSSAPIPGIYHAVLRSYFTPSRDSMFVLADSGTDAPLAAITTGSRFQVPGHWADTVKHEVFLALKDPAFLTSADSADVANVASALGLRLVRPDSMTHRESANHRPTPQLHLSRPGFNRDSTIAVIRASLWCGHLCGSGETLFLARRPGYDWRIWYRALDWVS